jgi:putative heme-binding domain-containing protein
MKLPREDATAAENVALVVLLRRLCADKVEFPLREKVVRLLRRNMDRAFGFEFGRDGYRPQPRVVDAWTSFATKAYPEHAAELLGGSETERARLAQLLKRVNWANGDVSRGRKLLAARACTQCHGGGRALGPDLAGAARRFSREDLFTAIALPNRDVSNRYQTTAVETEDGRIYSGLVIYRSVDGIILRDANSRTYRIEADEIVEQRTIPTSLMPTGLLKELTAQDLADLYAAMKAMSD